ncbi:hypothetical protein B0A55_07453 [Friedmanniomyces simplex]|uniref:peptidylprolyl isomerase n=1 Tax=Friedmanniomyces simplex TaxID=329884 RepID=A0A4U0X2J1_9PEZI|nr:hypothetical protein B0A55_07453 [Friedmanniomyces simplex]
MGVTLKQAGLAELAVNGVVDIYAVTRATSGSLSTAPPRGRDSIYRSHAHWEPPTVQRDRATAMFLSSLRVFASNVERPDNESDNFEDAVLHVFDLLTKYETLDRIIPSALVGTTHARVFEGSRLLFGFALEKARSLKLPEGDGVSNFPYLASIKEVDLVDRKTREPVMYALQTGDGLAENVSGGSEGAVAGTDPEVRRLALLSAGSTALLLTFTGSLASDYRYSDNGDVTCAWDEGELMEMHNLSEFCGRNKLAIHKPSQLAGAVAPCLTFDRRAHLAVYTGQEACGADPSRSTLMFRPMHGTEGVDVAVIEQVFAGTLKQHEADGTAVFDALGGAAVRRLQSPDEIVMFVVDTSASMRVPTDFDEVNEELPIPREPPMTANAIVDPEFFGRPKFDDIKDFLIKHESFEDMSGIVADAHGRKRHAATEVVELLRNTIGADIVRKHKELERRRARVRTNYYLRHGIQELEAQLEQSKLSWAGLKTHEQAAYALLQFRAETVLSSGSLSQRWIWSLGDDVPTGSPPNHISSLPASVVEISHPLRCPISHTLMRDAVTAADGHVYSGDAISRWFKTRKSSPMTGLELPDTTLTENCDVCDAVNAWIDGGNLTADSTAKGSFPIVFVSPYGTFERQVIGSMTMAAVHKLAFRGLAGRYTVFQLAKDNIALPAGSAATIA